MERKFRVKRFSRTSDPYHSVQCLQKKVWWGWKTVDEEQIPRACVMQHNLLGSTDWRSKYGNLPNTTFIQN